jgi:TRAP-type C4-dicarboxylate transport system permease large subunit
MSLLVITTPLLYTPITALGYDGVWLGIIIVTLIELGMITPPVGINVFVTAGTMPTLKVEEIFRAVVPFYVAEALIIATLFFFPILSTWLPAVSSA